MVLNYALQKSLIFSMTIVPSKAVVPSYPAVQAITHARQSHDGLYQENVRNGFRFLGYGLQEENETYGPGGRINGILGKRGDMVDIYV